MRQLIEELVELGPRGPGSDGERRAARHLEVRLRDQGREVDTEPIDVWPRAHVTYAFHLLLAIVGSVLSVSAPALGAGLVLLVLLLTFLDASGLVLTTRRLTGRRSSQNVISRAEGGKPGTLVLMAHLDAGRQGAAYGRWFQERLATLGKLIRRPVGTLTPLLIAMTIIFVCAVLRLVGLDMVAVTVVQFVPTVLLIIALPLLLDVALSDVSPGANDDASGVALAVELADHYADRLEYFDVWLLLTGGNEAGAQGARAFLKRHKKSLSQEHTVFVNIDEVGAGTVRYTRREGLAYSVRSHVQLLQICDDIAEDDEDTGAFGARSFGSRTMSDGYAARSAGYPAITVSCRNALDYVPQHHQARDLPENIQDEALDRARGFCGELIERLDAEIGPELDSTGEGTILSEAESS